MESEESWKQNLFRKCKGVDLSYLSTVVTLLLLLYASKNTTNAYLKIYPSWILLSFLKASITDIQL